MSCFESSASPSRRDRVDQRVGVEDVVAHRGEHLVRGSRPGRRVCRLLEELADPVGSSGSTSMTPNWSASAIGWRMPATVAAAPDSMCASTIWREVHAVDVVGADHDDDVGLLVVDEVEALQDRVGAAREPALAEPLLRRHRRRRSSRAAATSARSAEMCRSRLCDLYWVSTTICAGPRVDEVREREVDQPVAARRTAPRAWRGRR